MILFDVNVLLNAHRPEQPHHDVARELLEMVANAPEPYAVSELVLSAFLRSATNTRSFARPMALDVALDAANTLRVRDNARIVRPGLRHWPIFEDLCRRTQATGGLIADAYHAALAIEHGCEWISFDRDFAKFPQLRWRHPLD